MNYTLMSMAELNRIAHTTTQHTCCRLLALLELDYREAYLLTDCRHDLWPMGGVQIPRNYIPDLWFH